MTQLITISSPNNTHTRKTISNEIYTRFLLKRYQKAILVIIQNVRFVLSSSRFSSFSPHSHVSVLNTHKSTNSHYRLVLIINCLMFVHVGFEWIQMYVSLTLLFVLCFLCPKALFYYTSWSEYDIYGEFYLYFSSIMI